MSCYVSFFFGDFTKEGQDEISWDAVPCLLSISTKTEIGDCINRFPYDKPVLATCDKIEIIQRSLDEKIQETKNIINEYKEIKESILKNMPVKEGEYEDAAYHISGLNAEIRDLEDSIVWIIKQKGVLESIEDLISSKFSITVVVG